MYGVLDKWLAWNFWKFIGGLKPSYPFRLPAGIYIGLHQIEARGSKTPWLKLTRFPNPTDPIFHVFAFC